MAEVFISYKSERRAAAEHFAEVLKRYGFSVWFDYELVKGNDFAAQIERQIREAKAVVALWCTLSVGSRWVREEVHLAHDLGILVPVKIEPCEIPFGFRLADTVDLTGWDGAPRSPALDPLIDALEGRIGREAAPDRKALIEYEATWRRFGARSLKDFALNAKLAQAEARRFGPDESNGPDNGLLQWSKEEWERLKASADIGRLLRFAEHAHPYYAAEAREEVLRLQDGAERERKAKDERERGEAARRAAEEAARFQALKEEEARNRAGSRIRVQTPLPRPARLEWFLPGAGKEEGFKDAEFAPEMVVVPAGEFWMGSKDGEGRDSERPRHKVKIPKPFAVGRYAVTFDEWDAYAAEEKGFLGFGGRHKPEDRGWGRGRRPVVNVNWGDAQAYIKWLYSKTGRPYRLLSEAEWEYCCRAGTETPYSFGGQESDLDRYAWYSANSGGKTHPVGEKLPNEWGLHDMHGNVWEWCEDRYHGDYHNAPGDGSAWTPPDGTYGVLRGGSWYGSPRVLRAAYRSDGNPVYRDSNGGFRVALGWQDLNR